MRFCRIKRWKKRQKFEKELLERSTDDLRLFRHAILLGKSGTGKTKMLVNFQLLLDCKKLEYEFKKLTAGEPKEE